MAEFQVSIEVSSPDGLPEATLLALADAGFRDWRRHDRTAAVWSAAQDGPPAVLSCRYTFRVYAESASNAIERAHGLVGGDPERISVRSRE